jgi:hypothetical protein
MWSDCLTSASLASLWLLLVLALVLEPGNVSSALPIDVFGLFTTRDTTR